MIVNKLTITVRDVFRGSYRNHSSPLS